MSETTPVFDVNALIGQIMPILSAFITIFIMIYVFRSMKDLFSEVK